VNPAHAGVSRTAGGLGAPSEWKDPACHVDGDQIPHPSVLNLKNRCNRPGQMVRTARIATSRANSPFDVRTQPAGASALPRPSHLVELVCVHLLVDGTWSSRTRDVESLLIDPGRVGALKRPPRRGKGCPALYRPPRAQWQHPTHRRGGVNGSSRCLHTLRVAASPNEL